MGSAASITYDLVGSLTSGPITNDTFATYGPGLLYEITETATTTNTLTYHYDLRGSTIAITDNNGNVTDRVQYSAYGMITLRGGTNDTPFLYNGRYGVMTDPNGLLYMRARYYNPYLCRFMNPDPSGFAGGLNWYCYADGNSISNLDPFGLWTWTQTFGVARTIGGGLEAVAGAGLGAATSWTGIGAVAGGAVAVHGLDQLQAGIRQAWSGSQVDSLTSSGLQTAGVSRNAANLVDAGISVVGSGGAGIATAGIRATQIAANSGGLAQGLSKTQIVAQWEAGSQALNSADYWAVGGQFTDALYKYQLISQGVNISGDAYQLTTTALQALGTSIRLAPTGLTPLGYFGSGVAGSLLGGASGLGSTLQSSSTGK